MDNKELETEIKKIINQENFFDMILSAKAFEKQYKDSDFFKITKMPLNVVIEKSKIFYSLNINELKNKFQDAINNLDLTHLMDLIENVGSIFENENKDLLSIAEKFTKSLQ